MPLNPVQCSTRDGSGAAWPGAGFTPGTVKALVFGDERLELREIQPFSITRPAGYDLGVFAVDESAKELQADDLLDALRYTMGVPAEMIRRKRRIGLTVDPRVHGYAMDWQARIRKLFERSHFLPDDPGPTVCYGLSKAVQEREQHENNRFSYLMQGLHNHWDRAAVWDELQRYGHAPIPFNPATWTGAR